MWCLLDRAVGRRFGHRCPPAGPRIARASERFVRESKGLGLHIRALREDLGLTLEQASERTNVAPKHLQKIESGLLNVTLVTLVRIADGLDTSVRNLFPLPSPPQKPKP